MVEFRVCGNIVVMISIEDVMGYTDSELEEAIRILENERQSRQVKRKADDEVRAIVEQVNMIRERESKGENQDWVQPGGAGTSYLKGNIVIKDGKTYRSREDFNVTEPGTVDGSRWWEELVEENVTIEWTAGIYFYSISDPQGRTPHTALYKNQHYECTHEHLAQVGWEPDNPTMHAVWKRVVDRRAR